MRIYAQVKPYMRSAVISQGINITGRNIYVIFPFCSQDLHKQLENSNLDPKEVERAKKGQVSLEGEWV